MHRVSSVKSSSTNPRSAFRLCMGLTVLLLIAEAVVGGRTIAFLVTARPATATIVANVKMPDGQGGQSWQPTIEYADDHDQIQSVAFDRGSFSGSSFNYPAGTTTPIYFDPKDPQNVRSDTFIGIWIWPTVLGLLTLFFAVFAFGFRAQANEDARDNPWAAE